MDKLVPPHYMVQKIMPFSRTEDPKIHLKVFRVYMLISGGFDVVRCKMFVGTFT